MKLMTKLTLLLILALPLNVLAELPEQLKNDFSVINGIIIMPVGTEYLIDLDASSNLQTGDILTLVMPGEKIIHPLTNKVIGTLDIVEGYLQVTQIKSGYSYAKLLTADVTPVKGDNIKRFEQVPARFEASQTAPSLAEELKLGLPQLRWLSDTDTTAPILTFALSGSSLTVKSTNGSVLKSYRYNQGELSVPTKVAAQPNDVVYGAETKQSRSLLNQTVDTVLGAVGLGGGDSRLEAPGITQSPDQRLSDIWIGPNLEGNPVGVMVGDFDNDGQLETAIAMEYELLITRISGGKLEQIAIVEFPAGTRLLSIDTIDLDKNGSLEIYLSAISGNRLNSQVVEYKNGSYQKTMGGLRWFLRVVDLPQEGKTLVAQTKGVYETPFSDTPFRVIRSGQSLGRGEKLTTAKDISVFSFIQLPGTEDNPLYAHITQKEALQVSDQKSKKLWKSGENFGGSENSFYNSRDTNNKEMPTPVFIEPRILSLPSGEIIVAKNDGGLILRRYHNFTKSRIIALSWNGFSLQEHWRTVEQGGYLADFFYADADNDGQNELIMAVRFKKKTILNRGRSTVLIYELNE